MEYYSAVKKNSFESVIMRWMKLEPIIHSEVSQKGKIVFLQGLTNSCEKEKKQRRKRNKAEFQRIARRDKKAFLRDQRKEIEENNRMGKTFSLQEN